MSDGESRAAPRPRATTKRILARLCLRNRDKGVTCTASKEGETPSFRTRFIGLPRPRTIPVTESDWPHHRLLRCRGLTPAIGPAPTLRCAEHWPITWNAASRPHTALILGIPRTAREAELGGERRLRYVPANFGCWRTASRGKPTPRAAPPWYAALDQVIAYLVNY